MSRVPLHRDKIFVRWEATWRGFGLCFPLPAFLPQLWVLLGLEREQIALRGLPISLPL